jgi:uncharacterized membrane protein YraQ (UPF0718 family)
MEIVKTMKKNRLLVAVILLYIVAIIFTPSKAIESGKNSLYYIKEMLTIMPVIFILTSLIETWVPKSLIIKNLGAKSGAKGVFLSFALGSVSAGPIYAAFPICKMLLSKGASVFNIVIILSSWAVIKIPMLINEVKFLGFEFMIVRWILTTISILIIAYLLTKMVKQEDIPLKEQALDSAPITISEDYCINCGLCANKMPEIFEITNGKARVKDTYGEKLNYEALREVAEKCPVKAIALVKS